MNDLRLLLTGRFSLHYVLWLLIWHKSLIWNNFRWFYWILNNVILSQRDSSEFRNRILHVLVTNCVNSKLRIIFKYLHILFKGFLLLNFRLKSLHFTGRIPLYIKLGILPNFVWFRALKFILLRELGVIFTYQVLFNVTLSSVSSIWRFVPLFILLSLREFSLCDFRWFLMIFLPLGVTGMCYDTLYLITNRRRHNAFWWR